MSDPALVSVCLGVKNGIRTIERFIASVRRQTYPRVELVIVDNSSTDGTADVARRLADKFFVQGPERSAQRNRALQEASGSYALILDADQYLSPEVIAECVSRMENDSSLHGLFVPEETAATGFWGACKRFERDFYLIGDMSAEAARFFRREEVLSVGGYDEKQTGSEDWDLSDRMFARYGGFDRVTARLLHDEGHIDLGELVKKKKYYSHRGISEYLRPAPSYRRIPFPLRPSVRRQWPRLLLHPVLAWGMLYMKAREGLTIFGNHA